MKILLDLIKKVYETSPNQFLGICELSNWFFEINKI